jgi:hypothetical protein
MQNNYTDNSPTLVVLTQTVCYTSTCTMVAKVWVTEIQLFQKIYKFISTLFLSWSIIQEFVSIQLDKDTYIISLKMFVLYLFFKLL